MFLFYALHPLSSIQRYLHDFIHLLVLFFAPASSPRSFFSFPSRFETLARMSLTAVKQPGIALVYEQLLGFDGDEFYTASWPVRVHKTSACHRQAYSPFCLSSNSNCS